MFLKTAASTPTGVPVDAALVATRPPAGLEAEAVVLNRVFAPIRVLVGRSGRISFNARISSYHLGDQGAAFGVVAAELAVVARELDELLGVAEAAAAETLRNVARMITSERLLGKMRVARERTAGSGGGDRRASGPALAGLDRAVASRESILRQALDAVSGTAVRLADTVAGVERSVRSYGFFLAANSRIEASRAEAAADLATLAEEIAAFARELTTAVDHVEGRVARFRELARAADRRRHEREEQG